MQIHYYKLTYQSVLAKNIFSYLHPKFNNYLQKIVIYVIILHALQGDATSTFM